MTRGEAEGYALFLRATRREERDDNGRAIADLERARQLYPQSTQVRGELAWLYATVDGVDAARRRRAVALAQSAVDLEPECGDFWDSLAAVRAADGDFEGAARDARKAEEFADGPEWRGEFRSRRKGYERALMVRRQ
jgi:tetratricopeptide (TPR) repeat protein